ncbi:PsiF family protein [Roseomonas haemaphysalidis]|nr:PsiF family protein [Roseomonas haemaphysalidis]
MTSCNAEASTRNFAIDARRSFMSDCLAGRTPLPATPAPRR